jgi:hypothetical protein
MADNIHHIVTKAVIEGNFDFIHTALDNDGNTARRNDQRVAASAEAWRHNHAVKLQKRREIDDMIQRIHKMREEGKL